MADHLPAVMVVSIKDAENVPTHAGPLRVVLVRAASLSEARHVLSVLRAKGILRHPHGAAEGFDEFGAALEQQAGSGSDDSQGLDLGEGLQDDDLEQGEDLGYLYLALSDADADADHGHLHQAMHAHGDHAAEGWDVANLDVFRRAVDLGLRLEELSSDIIPRLVTDPADVDALDRLRAHGKDIRSIGKQVPVLMGQAPVTFGNYVKKTVDGAGKGEDWIKARCGELTKRVLALYDEHEVVFQAPGN